MCANDGVECRRLLSDDGAPVWIDQVVKRRNLVVHVRARQSSLANASLSCRGPPRGRLRASYSHCASEMRDSWTRPQPRRAASIAAMSIFFICIIASNARLAAAVSGSVTAFVRAIGVICQDNPHLSLHQPHALSWPPLPTIAVQ